MSIVTALAFGAGDFCGGVATRRAPVVAVLGGAHLVGLVAITITAVLWGTPMSWPDVGIGAIAGVFGAAGLIFLYRRLAAGPMFVVAPLTALTAAVVPALWSIATGERLTLLVAAGLAIGLVAIALASAADRQVDDSPVTATVVIESLVAGVAFGVFYILFDLTDPDAVPWPVVGARLVTAIPLLVVWQVVVRRRGPDGTRPARGGEPSDRRWRAETVGLVALAGLLDTGSNLGFLWATLNGSLAVVSVLTSLYPVATVALAWLVFGERAVGRQRLGLLLAIASPVAIALG
ncbi:MAG: EamA family transporter [Actinomycetota bacterium]